MKWFTYRIEMYRPEPYPCYIVYEKTTKLFLGWLPIKSTLKKIK